MRDFFAKHLRRLGGLGLALVLGACAAPGPTIKEEVAAAASPTQGLIMAANNLATLTRSLPGTVPMIDSAGKCARVTEQMANALEAVVIAETRYMKAVPPTAPEPPGVHDAMRQLDIANQPQIDSSFKILAAKCRNYANNKKVTDAIARMATACSDIEQLEQSYNARKPHPKPAPSKSSKGKGKGKGSSGKGKGKGSSSKGKGHSSSSTHHHRSSS